MSKRKRGKRQARPLPSSPPPPKKRRWIYGAIGALVVAAIAFGAWYLKRDSGPGFTPNLLFITLDTVRADRVGCYGYDRARTAAIDSLAASGVRFEEAYAHVPLTFPSHVSLFTGMYPPTTRIHVNGAAGLGPNVATLAQVFRRRGYRTGAFIAADVLHSTFGLNQGFDTYADDLSDGSGEERSERPANEVADEALRWLQKEPHKAFFAWVHFYDPHMPYDPPPPFASAESPYDGEVAFVDSQVERLLAWLDETGLRERTMIVVVGDHGEGLQDHGESTHGLFVYNTTMRVPLIVSFPALLGSGRTVGTPVRLVDVFPTVVDLLGWDSAGAVDGESLARACRTGRAPEEAIYGESEYPLLGFGWAPLRFLVAGRWKYIGAPRAELYDLRADPLEQSNVIDEHAEVAGRMRDDLAAIHESLVENRPDVGSTTPDPEMAERLRSLGYVGTTAPASDADDASRRDPKMMLDVVQGFEQAFGMFRAGDFEGAARTLTPLVERSPESDELFRLLGFARLRQERYPEAQQAFEASLREHSDYRDRWWGLGVALKHQGRLQEGLACFEQALQISPDYDLAHQEIAPVLSQLGRRSEAESHLRRCLELNPRSVPCLVNLGTILRMARKPAEAAPLLERALAYDPRNEHAHRGLWRAWMSAGRKADARRSLEKAHEAFPNALTFRCPLAWFRATTAGAPREDVDQAVAWAQQCCDAESSNPRNFDILAAAHAARGDFSSAVIAAQRALELVPASGKQDLRGAIAARLRGYESGRPFVDPSN